MGLVACALVFLLIAWGDAPPLALVALVAAAGGFWLWVRPPRTHGGAAFEGAGLALVASWLAGFLPVPSPLRGGWWPAAFSWGLDDPSRQLWKRRRDIDITGLGIDLDVPPMLSLQPWITWEAILPWIAAGVLLYGVGSLGLTAGVRALLLRATVAGAAIAGLAAAVGFPSSPVPQATGWVLASVAVVPWVLALQRFAARAPILDGVALVAAGAMALVGSGMTAGVAPVGAALAGVAAFAAGSRLAAPRRLLAVLAAAIVVGGLGTALLPAPEGRAPASATLAMVADQPLLGVGWGNHAALVPQYVALEELPPATVSAPRRALAASDWLRWAGEGGLLGFGAAVAWFVFAAVRLRRVDEAEDPEQRWPAAAACAVLAAGTVWDTPLGTAGGLAAVAWLLSLARPLRRPGRALGVGPIVWRGLGGVALSIGLLYLAAGLFRLPVHSTTVTDPRPADLHPDSNPAWSLTRWDEHMREVGMRPLDGRAYLERARTRAATGKNLRLLPVDIGRAEFLFRDDPWVPLWLGVALAERDRGEAVNAWHRAFTHPAADPVALREALLPWTRDDRGLAAAVDLLARGAGLREARRAALGGSP